MSRTKNRIADVQRTTGRVLRQISCAIGIISLSPIEEEFFREGEKIGQKPAEKHDFSDLDHGFERPSLWRAMLGWLRGARTPHPD